MHPVICEIGQFHIYSYGLLLAIGVFVSTWLLASDALRMGVKKDVVYDLAFWVVLCGIIGARFFYIFLNLDHFLQNPTEIVMLHKGGLAWQGSFIGGLVSGIIFLRSKKIPLWPFLDIAAPYIALGHAIGRIGCLLNGCCYGKPAVWGLFFPVWGERLVPTQIFMSVGQIGIFLLLKAFSAKARFEGQVFIWYLMLSSVERFSIEFFRADHELYWGLSIFQYVCVVIFLAGMATGHYLKRAYGLKK
jgi:phosphatidylglycerol:prolipoprotein diacylglycerol transferase